MMKVADRVISKIAMPVIIAAGILLIAWIVLDAKGTTTETNGYIRVINCVISVPAGTRTQGDIETCYIKVEKELNIKLQRYDSSGYKR